MNNPQTLLVGIDESDCAEYRMNFADFCGPRYDCCAIWIGWRVPAYGHYFDRIIYTGRFLDQPAAVTAGIRYWAETRKKDDRP